MCSLKMAQLVTNDHDGECKIVSQSSAGPLLHQLAIICMCNSNLNGHVLALLQCSSQWTLAQISDCRLFKSAVNQALVAAGSQMCDVGLLQVHARIRSDLKASNQQLCVELCWSPPPPPPIAASGSPCQQVLHVALPPPTSCLVLQSWPCAQAECKAKTTIYNAAVMKLCCWQNLSQQSTYPTVGWFPSLLLRNCTMGAPVQILAVPDASM